MATSPRAIPVRTTTRTLRQMCIEADKTMQSINPPTPLIPHRFARPRMVSYIPSPYLVTHMEFNLSKIYYLIGIALYLQYWEGSTVQADGKTRIIARAA